MADPLAASAGPDDTLVLDDGTRLTVRPITPASKPLLAAAMKRLSPESIRRRFSSPRRELSDLELHRLTAMDGWNQYAIGACGRAADGTLEGIGIARYARLPGDDAAAEIAVTVVDAFQHRGIGLALLERIVEAATARGIRRLDAMVLPENRPVIGLLRRLAPWARWRPDEGQLIAEIPLRAEPVVVSATG